MSFCRKAETGDENHLPAVSAGLPCHECHEPLRARYGSLRVHDHKFVFGSADLNRGPGKVAQ